MSVSSSSDPRAVFNMVEIQGTNPGPKLLITAGVHGDEYEGIEAIRELIALLQSHEIRGKVTLVPVVNGEAYRLRSRTASDGKDLARTCPGSPEGTITERTADLLSSVIRQADYYIDLHTGGFRFKLLPLVGYMLHPDQRTLEAQRRLARAFQLPLIWGTSPHLDGRSLSVARDANIPAIYTEYGGGGGCNPQGVREYVHGCLNVMAELGLLDRPVSQAVNATIVEDARPDSGHLQIHHPAPCAGYFRSSVALGDRVRRGNLIGSIVDELGHPQARITAGQTGTILLLADCPIVEQGDALAVILEDC